MKALLAALILVSASAEALLPPVWQGVAEIRAIVNSKELNQYLDSGDILESITKHEEGWIIQTNRSSVFVKVKEEPQDRPGPEKFHLEFSSPIRN